MKRSIKAGAVFLAAAALIVAPLTAAAASTGEVDETPVVATQEVATEVVEDVTPAPAPDPEPDQATASEAVTENQPAPAEPEAQTDAPAEPEESSAPSVSIAQKSAQGPPEASKNGFKHPKKVWVCKYVGTPGVDEVLKGGKNPIEVSVNTLKGFDGTFPWEFADKQGRSVAVSYAEKHSKPPVCDVPDNQEPPEEEPPTNACVPNGTPVTSTNLVPLWGDVDTRSAGHYEYVDGGLHIWTDDNSSQAKVSLGYPASFPLYNTGVLDIQYEGTGIVPGINLFVDFDNDGTQDGTLVYEAVYGQDLWLTGGSAQFVKDAAPVVGGGNGSQWHGTIDQWLTKFPEAQVNGIAFALGSGVHGNGVIKSITVGCTTYLFDYVPPAPVSCVGSGVWYTEADDLAPEATAEGLLFAGGSGKAVGYRLGVTGNLQGWTSLSFDSSDIGSEFFFRMVVDLSDDGGQAYQSLSFPGYTVIDQDSVPYQFPGKTIADLAAEFPNNQIMSIGFQTNSAAPADFSAMLYGVTSDCGSIEFGKPKDKVEIGEWSEPVITCEHEVGDEITITREVTITPAVFDFGSGQWVPGTPEVTTENDVYVVTEADIEALECEQEPTPTPTPTPTDPTVEPTPDPEPSVTPVPTSNDDSLAETGGPWSAFQAWTIGALAAAFAALGIVLAVVAKRRRV